MNRQAALNLIVKKATIRATRRVDDCHYQVRAVPLSDIPAAEVLSALGITADPNEPEVNWLVALNGGLGYEMRAVCGNIYSVIDALVAWQDWEDDDTMPEAWHELMTAAIIEDIANGLGPRDFLAFAHRLCIISEPLAACTLLHVASATNASPDLSAWVNRAQREATLLRDQGIDMTEIVARWCEHCVLRDAKGRGRYEP